MTSLVGACILVVVCSNFRSIFVNTYEEIFVRFFFFEF